MMGRGPERRSCGRRGPPPPERLPPKSRTRVWGRFGTEGVRGASGGGGGVSGRGGAVSPERVEGIGGGGVGPGVGCREGAGGSTGLAAAAGGIAFSVGCGETRGGSALLAAAGGGKVVGGTEVPAEGEGTLGTLGLMGVSAIGGLPAERPNSGAGRGLVSSTGILRSAGGTTEPVERCGVDAEPLLCFCTSCTT